VRKGRKSSKNKCEDGESEDAGAKGPAHTPNSDIRMHACDWQMLIP
jgi:hypothetical protein